MPYNLRFPAGRIACVGARDDNDREAKSCAKRDGKDRAYDIIGDDERATRATIGKGAGSAG